jgi:pimeloyl-ACP methyl ester carboxylesterase
MIRLQQHSFKAPDDPHQYDDEPIVVHARRRRPATNLVLLVHDLAGHRYGYWGATPQFILEDLPAAEVGLYFYRTAWRRFGLFRSIDLDAEARVLADVLRQLRRYRAITLVGHSMGGLVAEFRKSLGSACPTLPSTAEDFRGCARHAQALRTTKYGWFARSSEKPG